MTRFKYEVVEWWDEAGTYHKGSPPSAGDWNALRDDAVQVTVRLTDKEGMNAHFTSYSHMGWTEEELEHEARDAYESGNYG